MLDLLTEPLLGHASARTEEQRPVPLGHQPQRFEIRAEEVRPQLLQELLAHEIISSRSAYSRRLAASALFNQFHRATPCPETVFSSANPAGQTHFPRPSRMRI